MDRSRARQLATESFAQGDPTGWFERLYQEGPRAVPWADQRPNPSLVSWWQTEPGVALARTSALVVGCGLGDDAEQLAAWGARVTAFDIAPTAIATARERFPDTKVDYRVADLFNAPPEWTRRFDFVFEAYTLQALPADVRPRAFAAIAELLAPSGALLVVARGREETDPAGDMPWPLTPQEMGTFDRLGLIRLTTEDYLDGTIRRLRVLYRRL